MKIKLRLLFSYIAKLLAVFFTVLTLAIVIISFTKPEWIKESITWIGELIQ